MYSEPSLGSPTSVRRQFVYLGMCRSTDQVRETITGVTIFRDAASITEGVVLHQSCGVISIRPRTGRADLISRCVTDRELKRDLLVGLCKVRQDDLAAPDRTHSLLDLAYFETSDNMRNLRSLLIYRDV